MHNIVLNSNVYKHQFLKTKTSRLPFLHLSYPCFLPDRVAKLLFLHRN